MSLLLLNGDCLELMKDVSDNSVDLIICDLPYGCLALKPRVVLNLLRPEATKPVTAGATQGCPWDVKIDMTEFWNQAQRILRNEHSPVIHFCNTRFGIELINSKPDWFRYDLVWNKGRSTSFLNANRQPLSSHEMIYVFSKKNPYYNRIDVFGDFSKYRRIPAKTAASLYSTQFGTIRTPGERDDGKRCVTTVFFTGSPRRRGGHPTEKPPELYRKLIERYCPAGGTVLDPTCGSGNSVFEAFDMDRHAIGMEKDEGFFKKLVERVTGMMSEGDLIEHA